MTRVKLINAAAPGTPATGSIILYSKTDKKAYIKDDAGLETALGGGGVTIKTIQYGTVTIVAGAVTGTATITSVDTTKTFLLHLGTTYGGTGIGYGATRITLTNATTITATRALNDVTYNTVTCFCVIELTAVKNIQYGTATIAAAATSGTATITSVDTTKTFLLHLGQSTSAEYIPYGLSRIVLTNATTVTATRAATDTINTVVASFCAVEFA